MRNNDFDAFSKNSYFLARKWAWPPKSLGPQGPPKKAAQWIVLLSQTFSEKPAFKFFGSEPP